MKTLVPKMALILLALTASACIGTTATPKTASPSPTMSNSTAVKTDLAELAKFIVLPGTPSGAHWQITRLGPDNNDNRSVPGPSTYELTAVIAYSPENLAQLKTHSTASDDSSAIDVGEDFFLSWFPPSVKAAFVKQADGRYKFNASRYNAQAFYKTPYDEGSLLFISPTEVLIVVISD